MARNREKAASMLNRWTTMKLHGIDDTTVFQRPIDVKEVKKLNEAETWRRQCLKEIDDKVAMIQNPSLGEHRTRDLNDEINRLLLELKIWEKRIIELNGADYSKLTTGKVDNSKILEIDGYKYFGAARDLPGVRELYERHTYKAPKKTRSDLVKNVDSEYYGFKDENDIELEKIEKEAEEKVRKVEIEKFIEIQKLRKESSIPSQEEIEKALLEKKKREILNKY